MTGALPIDLILFAAGSVPSSTDFQRYMWQFEGHHTQLVVVPSLVDVAADRVRTRPLPGCRSGSSSACWAWSGSGSGAGARPCRRAGRP